MQCVSRACVHAHVCVWEEGSNVFKAEEIQRRRQTSGLFLHPKPFRIYVYPCPISAQSYIKDPLRSPAHKCYLEFKVGCDFLPDPHGMGSVTSQF